MKRILGILVLLASIGLVVTSCKKEDKKINANLIENTTIIKFEREIVDFGKLNDGEKVTCSFKFKNAGESDLFISSVSANCGCTVADYPREPISPGEEGQITVTYDSSNSSGLRISKEISVLTNTTPPTTTLRVVADIL